MKILGVEQVLRDGERESYHETANIVMSIAKDLNTEITPQDVSIAHRLPAYNGVKPIICRFTRRTKKIELLTKKKNFFLMKISVLSNIQNRFKAGLYRVIFLTGPPPLNLLSVGR